MTLIWSYSIIVSPSEFYHHSNGTKCKEVSKNIIKKFEVPGSTSFDKSAALNDCEMYCAKDDLCWGCTRICNGSDCQLNAISECIDHDETNTNMQVSTSEKTGNIVL